jgi:hypothetical protein
MRGARGFVLGVTIPVVLFAGITVGAQVVSPARGQSLLPTLPDISVVALPHGASAQVYLEPGRPGVNQFHVIVTDQNGAPLTARPVVRATRRGGGAIPLRMARLSPGHYLSVTVLRSGTWRFDIEAPTGSGIDRFSIERTLK